MIGFGAQKALNSPYLLIVDILCYRGREYGSAQSPKVEHDLASRQMSSYVVKPQEALNLGADISGRHLALLGQESRHQDHHP